MAKKQTLNVKGSDITLVQINQQDYISLTDIAKHKSDDSSAVIGNWMRNRNTIEFLGVWETLFNPDFKPLEFEGFKKQAGLNAFTLSPQKWLSTTQAIGLLAKAGRYGGTYAHKDIALKFASWISVEFELYLIKEFQRLKQEEHKQLGWDVKRQLTKINFRIHTNAVKENLIPPTLSQQQTSLVYATEADLLNMALFGLTAKQWRDKNANKEGNMRDYANVSQLVCLANLETLNAHFIQQALPQAERLILLNNTAIQQMHLLTEDNRLKKLEEGKA
jgi:hypothetical protein